MGLVVPEIFPESGGKKKIKWKQQYLTLVGPIYMLSAEKRTERSSDYGLTVFPYTATG